MKFQSSISLGFFVLVALISCKKEDTALIDNATRIQGNWKFIRMEVYSQSTISTTEEGNLQKSVTTSNYTTKENTGTVSIDSAKFNFTEISYTIDTVVQAEFYTNNVLVFATEVPFGLVQPSYNASINYNIAGRDSVYFQNGFIKTPDASGITLPSVASGSKIAWSGDTLVLNTPFNRKNTQKINGATANVETEGIQVIKLKQ